MFMGISHTKLLCKIEKGKISKFVKRGTYCKISIITLFLKLAHFDEIEIFQFLTNFTKIDQESHLEKCH